MHYEFFLQPVATHGHQPSLIYMYIEIFNHLAPSYSLQLNL